MDAQVVQDALKRFIRRYKTSFDNLGRRQSQLLELSALAMAAEHYKRKGYAVSPSNLVGRHFKVKLTARGNPLNFSWFQATKNGRTFEIHANFPVQSFYQKDGGIYVVDVAVVKASRLPHPGKMKGWKALENVDLITFIEAKQIIIYPMLLAQFVGIVHEIKPRFLGQGRPRNFRAEEHFLPALISVGYLHGTSANIRRGFDQRGFKLNVIPAFDIEIAKLRGQPSHESPFAV